MKTKLKSKIEGALLVLIVSSVVVILGLLFFQMLACPEMTQAQLLLDLPRLLTEGIKAC